MVDPKRPQSGFTGMLHPNMNQAAPSEPTASKPHIDFYRCVDYCCCYSCQFFMWN